MFKVVNPAGDGNIFLCNISKFLLHHTVEEIILHILSQFSIIHVYGQIKLCAWILMFEKYESFQNGFLMPI